MKRISVCLLLFTAITLLGFVNDVRAASLSGKVIEVNDGDHLTVFNLNRAVKIRLMGVDAPEPGQPFADVAKQHLRDLVFDKFVTVDYSGLGASGSIIGKVTVAGVDVCAQMIRDGACWFDVNNSNRLSEMDRQIYSQSEAAARSEKRGVWQSEKAIAPWEFTRLQALGSLDGAGLPSKPKPTSVPKTQLTPEAVLGPDFVIAGDPSNMSNMNWALPVAREWRQFAPPGQNFSVFVPAEGRKSVETMMFRDTPINTYAYMVRDLSTMYTVLWRSGPYLGETDEYAVQLGIAGVIKGFGESYEKRGEKYRCEAKNHRDVPVKDYMAREFDLVGCHRPGIGRLYTTVSGQERRFVMGLSFFKGAEPNIRKFFNSFTLTK